MGWSKRKILNLIKISFILAIPFKKGCIVFFLTIYAFTLIQFKMRPHLGLSSVCMHMEWMKCIVESWTHSFNGSATPVPLSVHTLYLHCPYHYLILHSTIINTYILRHELNFIWDFHFPLFHSILICLNV